MGFNSKNAIALLESIVSDPSKGLPMELFLFISRMTPMVNVDLLIKNTEGCTLLTWRKDRYYGCGWHVPGGIIRFKETIAERINKVAQSELGVNVKFNPVPLTINEVIHPTRKDRGHFISLLYECMLVTPLAEKKQYLVGDPKPGQWMWHKTCPKNIIPVHRMYCKYIG